MLFLLLVLSVEGLVIRTQEIGVLDTSQVAVASDGSVFVLSWESNEVHKFTPDGALEKRFGGKGQGPGHCRPVF